LVSGILFKERRHDPQPEILDPPPCGFSWWRITCCPKLYSRWSISGIGG
jgi:hypothetical protein